MTDGADIPAALRTLVTAQLGPGVRLRSCAWPRPNSRVWQADAPGKPRMFAKVHPTAKFFRREVGAFATWVPALGAAAPRLLAADASVSGIVMTGVPGTVLTHLELSVEEQRRAHQAAGALLRRIHDTDPPGAQVAAVSAVTVEKTLRRAVADDWAGAAVRAAVTAAARLTLPAVHTHGDYQPRNWLRDGDGTLSTIDFERAEPGPAVRDLRLLPNGAWAGRPDLRAAFFAGYGRALTADEDVALAAWVALDAVDSARWGRAHGDADVEARGRVGLARLRDGP